MNDRDQRGRHYPALLDVLANTPAADSAGQAIATWSPLFQIYGRILPAAGSKSLVAGEPTADVTHAIRCPYRDGVLAQHRLRWRPFRFTADAATDLITVFGRTPVAGERVRVSSSGTLPGGLVADLDLFARDVSGATCRLSRRHNGAAIDITSAGSGTHYFGERLFDVAAAFDDGEQRRELLIHAIETK